MVWRSIFGDFGVHKFARELFLLINDLFKTNYANPLRQPYANLTYGVDLKHRNSILKFLIFGFFMWGSGRNYLFIVGVCFGCN